LTQGLTRITLGIEYDGSCFSGWQRQGDRRTIQASVECAVSKVADESVSVCCAGRTDAGVHAVEQVVHFDTDAQRTPVAWVMGTNTNLPHDVRVLWAKSVSPSFHARYSAIARFYRYLILNRATNSALLHGRVTWCFSSLNVRLMAEAAQFLIGEHDFTSFRAKGCQSKSPNRKLHHIAVVVQSECVVIDIVANAFLHHMVRNIVGVLIEIGMGKKQPGWARDVLMARDRALGGVTARASGLYLEGVYYPSEFGMAKHPIFERLPSDVQRFNNNLNL